MFTKSGPPKCLKPPFPLTDDIKHGECKVVYPDIRRSDKADRNLRSLVRRDDPTGDWYSFVETVRRDGLAKSTDGAVRKVDLYAVTWVMTPEKHRRESPSVSNHTQNPRPS